MSKKFQQKFKIYFSHRKIFYEKNYKLGELYHEREICENKYHLNEFIEFNLNLLKDDIEKDIKKENPIYLLSKKNDISTNKTNKNKKPFEIFFDKYQMKYQEISDDITKGDYFDISFKENFFKKFLYYDKMLLKPKTEILVKNFEVKISIF